MGFTSEALAELGLSQDQMKEVFSLYGKAVNSLKLDLEGKEQENESLKKQLQHSETQLETMKQDATTSAEQKTALEELQAEYDKFKQQAADELAQTKKVNAINLALKDTSAYNPDKLMKFLDVDAIELDENGKPKLETVINELKESDPYLFKSEDEAPNLNIFTSGNPTIDGGGKPDPFQAIIDGYGK